MVKKATMKLLSIVRTTRLHLLQFFFHESGRERRHSNDLRVAPYRLRLEVLLPVILLFVNRSQGNPSSDGGGREAAAATRQQP